MTIIPSLRLKSSYFLAALALVALLAWALAVSRWWIGPLVSTPHLLSHSKLPLAFEPNVGQAGEQAHFLAHARGGVLYFAPSEVVLSLPSLEQGDAENVALMPGSPRAGVHSSSANPLTVHMQFVGSNPASRVVSGARMQGKVNYLLGNSPAQWHTNLPTYADITYDNLYPGVALSYSGDAGQLKGTYTVSAGADPARIRWRYAGVARPDLDREGNLQLTLPGTGQSAEGSSASLTERAPTAWQEIGGHRVPVDAAYSVGRDGSVGFHLGTYDHAYPLIIDPILAYSSYLGGSLEDRAEGVALDSSGNIYLTGKTQSLNFPTANAYQPANAGNGDAFVSKLNPNGSALIYSTYLGGSMADTGEGIAVDGNQNIYVDGFTTSTNFPVANAIQPTNHGGDHDAFLAKLSPDGSALVYSTYLGGSGGDQAGRIALDSQGSVYMTGETSSSNFPLANAYQPTFRGWADGFVTKINAAGSSLVYSTYLGGVSGEGAYGLAVDAGGSAYVCGITYSADFPVVNAYQPVLRGAFDAYLTKFNPAGTALMYSTYLGGTGSDVGFDVGIDGAGSAYVAGWTNSSDFPLMNAFQGSNHGQYDAFMTKFTTNGTALVYSTYLGGSGDDYAYGVIVDSSNHGYLTGPTASNNFPLANPIQSTFGGVNDTFVTRMSVDGMSLDYSTYLGGSGDEFSRYLALDAGGSLYVSGYTQSNNFPTVNPYQPALAGDKDAFIAKIVVPSPTSTRTNTPSPSPTRTPTNTPTQTATPCPMNFSDVQPGDYFYNAVRFLYCRGVISGYGDGTFKPYNNTTRGQLCKIVVLAYSIPLFVPPEPTFSDVPSDHTFYVFVETAAHNNIVSGYADGTFRPANNVTRGQLCKIVVIAAQWPLITPENQTFVDVPRDHPFYSYIETAYCHGIISGYADGLFRPGNNATRGQICKIVYEALVGGHACGAR